MTSNDHQINFILEARKILSVNALYAAKLVYSPRGPIATIYKSGEAKKTESYIKEQVSALNIPVNYPWATKDTLFRMDVMVIFKSGYLLRDLDNTLKLLQDGIFRAMGFNDSHVVSIVAHKKLFPEVSNEKIFVSLTEVSKDDIRFDSIPSPHIIWSEENTLNLKSLPKRGIKADVKYYTSDKTQADTKLYFLGPQNFTPSYVTQIIRDLSECVFSSNGFCYVAIQGDESSWGAENWAELERTKKEIIELSQSYSGIKIGLENEIIKEILK